MAKLYEINNEILDYFKNINEISDLYYEESTKLLNAVNEISKKFPLKKGDFVELKLISGYRNDGLLIYDSSVIYLDYKFNEYGHLPEQFAYPEFPIRYFENVFYYHYINFDTSTCDGQLSDHIYNDRNCYKIIFNEITIITENPNFDVKKHKIYMNDPETSDDYIIFDVDFEF